MQAAIVTIGDEILIGQIINSNAALIAQRLNNLGVRVVEMISVGDNRQQILDTLNRTMNQANIIVITGGLGPTSDDITKPALCEFFNSKLVYNQEVFEQIKQFLAARGGVLNQLNESQAYVPDNCTILPNDCGTAPGLWFEKNEKIFIALPGVPFEMEKMLNEQVLPKIKNRFNIEHIYHRTILTTGIAESKLAEHIQNWEKNLPAEVKVAYLPSPGMVRIRLSVYNNPNGLKLIKKAENDLLPLINQYVFGFDDDTLEKVIGQLLFNKKLTVSTAESCTGGNIAHTIISVPGASNYFKGGVVVYSNESKIRELGISSEIIEKHGVVSQPVVEAMARACRTKFATDYAIAVSGIAGPDGGTPEKPVGTVWIAIASATTTYAEKFLFGDNRQRNIIRTTFAALNLLRKSILY